MRKDFIILCGIVALVFGGLALGWSVRNKSCTISCREWVDVVANLPKPSPTPYFCSDTLPNAPRCNSNADFTEFNPSQPGLASLGLDKDTDGYRVIVVDKRGYVICSKEGPK